MVPQSFWHLGIFEGPHLTYYFINHVWLQWTLVGNFQSFQSFIENNHFRSFQAWHYIKSQNTWSVDNLDHFYSVCLIQSFFNFVWLLVSSAWKLIETSVNQTDTRVTESKCSSFNPQQNIQTNVLHHKFTKERYFSIKLET